TRSLIGEHPIIRIELKINGETYNWSKPFPSVEVSIPYTPSREERTESEFLTIWYVDPTGEAVAVPSGRYDPNTGMVNFAVAHFSDYAVAFVNKSFAGLGNVPWARKPVEVLAAKGVISDNGAHPFQPGEKMTRADFLLMLVRMLGLTVDSGDD